MKYFPTFISTIIEIVSKYYFTITEILVTHYVLLKLSR